MLVRLLQFASPMLPIGAFSYSSGLESAIEAGDVQDAESGARWIGERP
jgi:urease accessory protein